MTGSSLTTDADLLHQSLDKDPNFSEANARLSFACLYHIFLDFTKAVDATLSKASRHPKEAIKLDDRSLAGKELSTHTYVF